jgi:hypothetical protein
MDEEAFIRMIDKLPISRTKQRAAEEDLAASNVMVGRLVFIEALVCSCFRSTRNLGSCCARLLLVKCDRAFATNSVCRLRSYCLRRLGCVGAPHVTDTSVLTRLPKNRGPAITR